MRFAKSLLIAAMASLFSVGMNAQCCGEECPAEKLGYKPYPYNFIQVQGGLNKVFSPAAKFNPTFSVGVGRMFTPIVGARLHVNGLETKNGFKSVSGNYKFKYITTDADLMVNVLNIFSKSVVRPLDVYLVGGLGLSYAWDNKQFASLHPTEDISNAWGPTQTPRQSLLSHNLRAGVLVDYNICKNFSVGVEVDVNSLDDRFNSKFNDADDWMMTAQLSLTYKFGHKKPTPRVAEPERVAPTYTNEQETVTAKTEIEAPVAVAAEVKKVVEEEIPLKETIYYAIRENTPNPDDILNRVVAWAKKYPNKTIDISGYADKGTGNPKINVGYAKRRADSVCKELIKRGVPADQMVVNSYGDTVQPFKENDLNRCVIIIGSK